MPDSYVQSAEREGFSFWPLERVKTVPEEALNHNGDEWSSFPGAESFFVLDWSWWYAIVLRNDLSEGNAVFLIGMPGFPVCVARSFSEFVDLYLIDSPKLYLR